MLFAVSVIASVDAGKTSSKYLVLKFCLSKMKNELIRRRWS